MQNTTNFDPTGCDDCLRHTCTEHAAQMADKGPSFRHVARTALLKKHSIETRLINGRLEALDVYTFRQYGKVQTQTQWVDVTSMTATELYRWLGY